MKFEVDTGYLAPITLGAYEWVSVALPDGRQVTVCADEIRVATEHDVLRHKDGAKIWVATAGPYGKVVPLAVCTECGDSPVVARGYCEMHYRRWLRAQKGKRARFAKVPT